MNRLCLASLIFLAGIRCNANVILSINPSAQTAQLGSQTSFHIDVSGLGNGTAVGTYDIDFGFDPTLLSFDSIIFGNQIDIFGLGDIQAVTPGIGAVNVFELSLDSASDLNSFQAPAFSLATLTFDTLALGENSPVTLSINALGDAFGSAISADIENGSVSVMSLTAVPEPNLGVPLLLIMSAFALSRVNLMRLR